MSKKKKPARKRVALKLPKKVGDLITKAQNVHDQMDANAATFPTPNPAMNVFQTDITTLITKEAACKTRVVGAVEARDSAQHVVTTDLNNERAYVEVLVNADPDNASEIAAKAGMALGAPTSQSKPDLAVKPGRVPGTVHVVAKAIKGAKTTQWQYSTDGGKTWIDLPSTTQSKTTVQNLTPGTSVMFRRRAVTKTGLGDWGQDVTHLVT